MRVRVRAWVNRSYYVNHHVTNSKTVYVTMEFRYSVAGWLHLVTEEVYMMCAVFRTEQWKAPWVFFLAAEYVSITLLFTESWTGRNYNCKTKPAQKVRIRRPTLLTIYRRLRRVRPPANIAGDLRHWDAKKLGVFFSPIAVKWYFSFMHTSRAPMKTDKMMTEKQKRFLFVTEALQKAICKVGFSKH